jgi:hypothetical protein
LFRRGILLKEGASSKKGKDKGDAEHAEFKRPIGVGALDLNAKLIGALVNGDEFSVTDPIKFYAPGKEEEFPVFYDALVDFMRTGVKPKDLAIDELPAFNCKGLTLSLNLYMGRLEDVCRKDPELSKLCTTKMMSFPEDIDPGYVRNDLYLSFGNCQIRNLKANNKEPKNISVTVKMFVDGD